MEEISKEIPSLDKLERLLRKGKLIKVKRLLAEVHPADIADLLDQLPSELAVDAFELLDIETASEVLDEIGGLVLKEILDEVDDELIADLLDELPMDDAAEFLEDLPEERAYQLLGLMEPDEAGDVRELLAYEEETAGRLMTSDIAMLRRQWTVNETLEYLRHLEETETLVYLYVVDVDDKLIGVVPLRALIKSPAESTIESIMDTDIAAVPVSADQEELAEMVARYDFYAIPVVDEKEKLVGVVTVDDVLDIFEEEATEDIQRLGGSEPLDQPYFAASIAQVFRKRVGWLLLLFVAGTLTGTVQRVFSDELQVVIALSFFIPLIIGTGGNAGSQTVATIIRAITLDEVRLSNMFKAMRSELSVGMLLGVVIGAIALVRALTWDTGLDVAMVVAFTLPIVVIWSVTVATIVPILADKVGIDPAVISGPMITTIVDATGLLIYFTLAKQILGI